MRKSCIIRICRRETKKWGFYIFIFKNGGLLRNNSLCQRGYLDGQKALIYAACRGWKQSREYHTLGSAKMLFYRSTRHRKSGQEVFDLLPAFCRNLYGNYIFDWLLILLGESLLVNDTLLVDLGTNCPLLDFLFSLMTRLIDFLTILPLYPLKINWSAFSSVNWIVVDFDFLFIDIPNNA